jgi:hypothetical protein
MNIRDACGSDRLTIESYHSISGLGDPVTSIENTASVFNKASTSVGFLLIFGPAKIDEKN